MLLQPSFGGLIVCWGCRVARLVGGSSLHPVDTLRNHCVGELWDGRRLTDPDDDAELSLTHDEGEPPDTLTVPRLRATVPTPGETPTAVWRSSRRPTPPLTPLRHAVCYTTPLSLLLARYSLHLLEPQRTVPDDTDTERYFFSGFLAYTDKQEQFLSCITEKSRSRGAMGFYYRSLFFLFDVFLVLDCHFRKKGQLRACLVTWVALVRRGGTADIWSL